MGMKWIITILLFAGCSERIAIPEGTFVGHFEHEYALNDDSLIIHKADDGKNIYNLTRHTGTVRKKDGKLLAKEFKSTVWILEYNEENKIFKELKTGRIITWNSKAETLQMGNTIYKRMKK
jgi:hypothetical protein